MTDADTPKTPPSPTPASMRKDLHSFSRDWARWSRAERWAATFVLVLMAVSPVVQLLP
ncbi:hypothetical protein [Azospirillum sp. TSO22-1]|uniref:hypothetical protein n=1 Tax=Azospirillum sp. TSO22-1 TaxID=716789 RepID=UPI001304CD09|nr:hypothetical protein [Azospirillum sp. TSO22-1]